MTEDKNKVALEWFEDILDERQSNLEDIFSIGAPAGSDYSEIHKELGYIKSIRNLLTRASVAEELAEALKRISGTPGNTDHRDIAIEALSRYNALKEKP